VSRKRSKTADFFVRTRNRLVREVRTFTGHNESEALRIVSKIMEVLCHEHGGADVYIPIAPRREIEDAVLRDLAEGRKPHEIAKQRGVHRATVYRIKAAHRAQLNPVGLATGTNGVNRP
jgi:hypothetical protein